jgi:hypothetical protein
MSIDVKQCIKDKINDTPITNKHKQYINGFADEFVPAYVCEELERKAKQSELFRSMIIACGRNAGGKISDDVSMEFLMHVENEIGLIKKQRDKRGELIDLLIEKLKDAMKSLNTISTWSHGDFDFFSVKGYANSRMTAAKEAVEKIEKDVYGNKEQTNG